MADALARYRSKRDFGATPEPPAIAVRSGSRLRFVVQEHHARRLHYDFRIELDGVLKSWAVPKGPSLEPGERRMAVQTEDHPLAYADFEGTIPPKQYGAGTITVWDRGHWKPVGDPHEGLERGKLKLKLSGRRLRGTWNLVRMRGRAGERGPAWLLMREADAATGDRVEAHPHTGDEMPANVPPADDPLRDDPLDHDPLDDDPLRDDPLDDDPLDDDPLDDDSPAPGGSGDGTAPTGLAPRRRADPRSAGEAQAQRASKAADAAAGTPVRANPARIAPQLATLVDAPPAAGDWLYELKFDGYRLLARVEGRDVRLITRNGNDWTAKLPALAGAVSALDLKSGWLDGEIVVPGADGVPDFQALQNAFDSAHAERIRLMLFDLLLHDGADLRRLPLVVRRERLRRLMTRNRSALLQLSESLDGDPASLLRKACEIGMEGLIGKRADSPYASGRSSAWIKLKCKRRQEFVVGGWTDPRGSRSAFGSLLLGVHDEAGLRYAGSVGTGFDAATHGALGRKLSAIAAPASPFIDRVPGARVHWVKPSLVAEVSFAEWTKEGRVRQAVFHGLRDDKPASSIHREQALPARAVTKKTAAGAANGFAAKTRTPPVPPRATGVTITHPDRVIDPSSRITKIELVRYVEAVAPQMLPHLTGRPVALLRAPGGLAGKRFFQKHAGRARIAGLRELDPSLDPGHEPMMQVDSIEALVGVVQMNAIELHVWNARSRSIERPDRIVFDLDPGEGVEWAQVLEGAQLTRVLLEELGLRCWVKTSGGNGLHVVVPIAARDGWDTVRDFARAAVVHMVKTIPARFVAAPGASRRIGRIFVDYLRNNRGATTVAAFSARARDGLPVSMPVAWDELESIDRGDRWTIRNAADRLARLRDDPWAAYPKCRQTLAKAIARLAAAAGPPKPRRRR